MAKSATKKTLVEIPYLQGVDIYPDLRVVVIRDNFHLANFMKFTVELIKWGGSDWHIMPPAPMGLQVGASAPWPEEEEGYGARKRMGFRLNTKPE